MIRKLDHKNPEEASKIREVFQESYAVEAKLLKAENNFPPLKRPLAGFIEADSAFHGHFENESLAGVIEIKSEDDSTHIQSLVVSPRFFRRGIGSQLLQFVIDKFDTPVFTVETGAANDPAIALYERFDFQITRKWMTGVGIEKVAMKRI